MSESPKDLWFRDGPVKSERGDLPTPTDDTRTPPFCRDNATALHSTVPPPFPSPMDTQWGQRSSRVGPARRPQCPHQGCVSPWTLPPPPVCKSLIIKLCQTRDHTKCLLPTNQPTNRSTDRSIYLSINQASSTTTQPVHHHSTTAQSPLNHHFNRNFLIQTYK